MGAHIHAYPVFDALTADELTGLLRRSRLSKTDRQIAVQYLVWRMPMIDIAVSHGYSRTAVSWRFRHVIVPELEHLMRTAA